MEPIKKQERAAGSRDFFVLFILCMSVWLLFFYSSPFAEAAEKKRWQYQPALFFYEQFSDNVDLLPEDKITAYITELGVGLTATLPSSRRQLKVDTNLKMNYQIRSDGTKETLYWIGLWGYMGYQASSRLSYDLSGSYDVTYTQDNLGAPFVDVVSSLTRAQLIQIRPALNYTFTKNSSAKLGLLFGKQIFKSENGVDGTEYGVLTGWEQRIGSRIKLNIGLNDSKKTFSNQTGYNKIEIPFGVAFDLTYLQLQLNGAYDNYKYENTDASRINNFSRFIYGFGADVGSQIFRLKATTVSFIYKTNLYDDLYGQPYVNNDFRIAIYHAYKKFDLYSNLKYGKDTYISTSQRRSYSGVDVGLKWYINEDSFMNFTGDYTMYKYTADEEEFVTSEDNKYNVFQGNVDYNRNINEWLFAGVAYSLRNSKGDTTASTYMENIYAVYIKASW